VTPVRRRSGVPSTAFGADFGARVVHFAMAPLDPTPQLHGTSVGSPAATVGRGGTAVTEVPWTRP
jgi:hypothetical protein